MYKRMISLIFALLVCSYSASIVTAQTVLLRHQFTPGQSAKAVTDVALQGKSIITQDQADTDLKIKMFREYVVKEVDAAGYALMDVVTRRIQTQGVMNGSPYNSDSGQMRNSTAQGTREARFDEDLTGDRLKQTMFGMDRVSVKVSPLGRVSEDDNSMPLSQLGISLPANMASSNGGFEFPTFPADPVPVGAYWTESGTVIPRYQSGNLPNGEWVYQLHRVYPAANGRRAVIRYQKTTDLSGLSMGSMSALQGGGMEGLADLAGPSAQVGGLVIHLEGEIEFNIDQGVVTKTTQQGRWNMAMNSNSGKDRKNIKVQQKGMRLRIQTQMQWGERSLPKPEVAPYVPPKRMKPETPQAAPVPPAPVVVPETKELP